MMALPGTSQKTPKESPCPFSAFGQGAQGARRSGLTWLRWWRTENLANFMEDKPEYTIVKGFITRLRYNYSDVFFFTNLWLGGPQIVEIMVLKTTSLHKIGWFFRVYVGGMDMVDVMIC